MGWFDPELTKALVTSGTGAGIGTLLKTIIKPESDVRKWFVASSTAIIVGTLAGGAVKEWLNLGELAGLAAAAAGALLSEQIIGFLQARGEGLKKGKLDISAKKDD